MNEEPLDYLIARIQEAFIDDDRLCEQALEVLAAGDRIVVRGQIATEERRLAALEVARGLAGDRLVVDDVVVTPVATPRAPEVL